MSEMTTAVPPVSVEVTKAAAPSRRKRWVATKTAVLTAAAPVDEILNEEPARVLAWLQATGGASVVIATTIAQAKDLANLVTSSAQFTVAPGNPGANNYTYTNNTGAPLTLLAGQYLFTADATVVNRFPQIVIKDAAANILITLQENTAVINGTSITIHAYQGATALNAASGNGILPLPMGLVVPAGGTVTLQAGNADAGDTITAITLVFSQPASSGPPLPDGSLLPWTNTHPTPVPGGQRLWAAAAVYPAQISITAVYEGD